MEDPTKELFGGEEEAKAPKTAKATAKPSTSSETARPILTEEEIEAARQRGRDRMIAALKEAELKRIENEEMEAFRHEEGKRTGDPDRDELIHVTVDLAEYADRLVINGTEYFHGYAYDVPRHVFESMRETMYRSHLLQRELDDKDLTQFYRDRSRYRVNEGVVLSGRGAA